MIALVGVVAGAVLVVLLATGVLSSKSGSEVGAPSTSTPTGKTTPAPGGAGRAAGLFDRNVPDPFGPDDWGTYGGSYDMIRHSRLTQITRDNVGKLGRVFSVDFRQLDRRVPKGQQSFPLAINGVLYVTTGSDFVFAIDARSGKEIWEFAPPDVAIFKNFGVTANRGLAYCDGKLFLLTLDMRLISIDPRNGHLVGSVPIANAVPGAKPEFGYSETQAPICYKNLVLVGAAGSDYGVRGFVEAYHPDLTPAWPAPYWTIPPWGSDWRRLSALAGGGTAWNPITIDPATDTGYFSVAAPSPQFVPELRPGPNPRTNSIVAIDIWTGRQKWWQQQLAGDSWSYGTSQPPLLYTGLVGGHRRKVVSVATKEGVWFLYDAATGAPIYSRVKLLNRSEHPPLKPGQPVTVYPGAIGGLNYSPSSYDPQTNLVVNSQAETASVMVQKSLQDVLKHNVLGDVELGLANAKFGLSAPGWHDFGSVTAIDVNTGQLAWKDVVTEPGRGGVTTTATGIAFVGGGDGALQALDTKTGAILWSFQTGYQIASGPTIFAVGGKEYVAITTGGTPSSSFGGTASQLDVFALGGDRTSSLPPSLRDASLPQPGTQRQSTTYLGLGRDSRTVTLQAALATDAAGHATIDGTAGGKIVVAVPRDWTVDVTASNQDGAAHPGLRVARAGPGGGPAAGAPAFSGGATRGRVPGRDAAYFSFRTTQEGDYVLGSDRPGQWLVLRVIGADQAPSIRLGGTTSVVDVTRGRP